MESQFTGIEFGLAVRKCMWMCSEVGVLKNSLEKCLPGTIQPHFLRSVMETSAKGGLCHLRFPLTLRFCGLCAFLKPVILETQ